jgi:Uma2 family endonuclease
VREYWLVDPRARMVTVFGSLGDRFDRGRVYEDGDTVESVVVTGLRIAVSELF